MWEFISINFQWIGKSQSKFRELEKAESERDPGEIKLVWAVQKRSWFKDPIKRKMDWKTHLEIDQKLKLNC